MLHNTHVVIKARRKTEIWFDLLFSISFFSAIFLSFSVMLYTSTVMMLRRMVLLSFKVFSFFVKRS